MGSRAPASSPAVTITGTTCSIQVLLPSSGDYPLRLFAKPRADPGPLVWALDYRIQAEADTTNPAARTSPEDLATEMVAARLTAGRCPHCSRSRELPDRQFGQTPNCAAKPCGTGAASPQSPLMTSIRIPRLPATVPTPTDRDARLPPAPDRCPVVYHAARAFWCRPPEGGDMTSGDIDHMRQVLTEYRELRRCSRRPRTTSSSG